MEMSVDEIIQSLKLCDNGFTGQVGNFQNTIDAAVVFLEKYQKIQEIMAKRPKDMISSNPTLRAISEVLCDGNVD